MFLPAVLALINISLPLFVEKKLLLIIIGKFDSNEFEVRLSAIELSARVLLRSKIELEKTILLNLSLPPYLFENINAPIEFCFDSFNSSD